VFQLATSGAIAAIVRALLLRYGNIPSFWIAPIWLSVFAIVTGVLLLIGSKWYRKRAESQLLSSGGIVGQVAGEVTAVSTFDPDVFLLRSYQGSFQQITENTLRSACSKYDPRNREDKLYKIMASGVIEFQYWLIWLTIYTEARY
jgi:hypothetical protein